MYKEISKTFSCGRVTGRCDRSYQCYHRGIKIFCKSLNERDDVPLKWEGWSKKSSQALDKGPAGWEEFKRCSWPEEVEGEKGEKVFQEKERASVKSGDRTLK